MFGDLFIDYVGRCVYCDEQVIPFSKKEFDIIEFLSLNAGQVFDRERIYERLWGYDAEGSSDILKEHIRRIRTKLAKVTSKNYIEKEHFGLGLTICKILAEKHGGTISLDNAPEGGARVTVKLKIEEIPPL